MTRSDPSRDAKPACDSPMRLSSRHQTRMRQSYAVIFPASNHHATVLCGESDARKAARTLSDRGSGPVVFGQAAERRVEAGVERLLEGLRSQAWRLLPVVGEVDEPRDQRAGGGPPPRLLCVEGGV